MRPHQLYRLICKDEYVGADAKLLHFYTSEWIDFRKFSQLLNVDHLRLRKGFLDQLGFPPGGSSLHYNGVRHCPICISHGYHSVFFDLVLINECPWHKVKLLSPCYKCAAAVRYKGLSGREIALPGDRESTISDYIISTPCEHVRFDTRNPNSFEVGARWGEVIENEAERFISWWRGVDNNQTIPAGAREMLIVNANEARSHRWPSYKDRVRSIIERQYRPSPWELASEAAPSDFIRWGRAGKGMASLLGETRTSDDVVIATYKSIRRHLLKKYVKKHRRCYNELTHVSRHESLCLKKAVMCTTSVAFVTWRLRIEKMDTPIELTKSRAENDDFEVMLCQDWSGVERLTLTLLAHNWYGVFFILWDSIEQSTLRNKGLGIVRNESGRAFSHEFCCGEYYPLDLKYLGVEQETTQWLLLPLRSRLTMNSLERCKKRRTQHQSIIDKHILDDLEYWALHNKESFDDANHGYIFYMVRDYAIASGYGSHHIIL